MKRKKRNVASEIIADLKEMCATLKAGIPLHEKYIVSHVKRANRSVRPLKGKASS
ncbi:MAG TPA: hypothetical protein VG269_02650 [Tepidisphaeraceae bacterium]|nr:hypothetical protein [Tepidisphaeraceae bacterium]